MSDSGREFNESYSGEHTEYLSYPMGGIGAGMICLDGDGRLSHVSLHNEPQFLLDPMAFSTLCLKGEGPKGANLARVLAGPVRRHKIYTDPKASMGLGLSDLGFPRFREASFRDRFPFGELTLRDRKVPLGVKVTGWSPFVPGDADACSLPVAGLEYAFTNRTKRTIEGTWSFHSENFAGHMSPSHLNGEAQWHYQVRMAEHSRRERPVEGGFVIEQDALEGIPGMQCAVSARVLGEPLAATDCAWYRGHKFDTKSALWRRIESGELHDAPGHPDGKPAGGASVYVPLCLEPGETRTVRLLLSWYAPDSMHRMGKGRGETARPEDPDTFRAWIHENERYRPWYAGRFASVDEVGEFWRDGYEGLQARTAEFTSCFYDTNLPPEFVEAVAANLTILKTTTCLRQPDGRFWGWEGSHDWFGSCYGSCTHVWNYAQALPHLLPSLERSLRQTEFTEAQDPETGCQAFRHPLPIRPADFSAENPHLAASDGQLGGLMKLHRDWRICGDTEWLRGLWPAARASLDYCIRTWDPDGRGVLSEPHHNTYDIEFWGEDGMCSSFYLGALKAATLMGEALGEDVRGYQELYRKGREYLETRLFNGEYFFQTPRWEDLHAESPAEGNVKGYSPEAIELLETEGPKHQYGSGCLTDGVLGAWMAEVCFVGEILDAKKVRKHLLSVVKYNLREDLSDHVDAQRPSFALGAEGGLLLCSWPKGGKPTAPFIYSDEVWTGIEYQVAAHLASFGELDAARRIVQLARRRYDGRVRNPYEEIECGRWYARAMSSYGLLQCASGVRYDAVARTLFVRPCEEGERRVFLSTASGFGTVSVRGEDVSLEVCGGQIPVENIETEPPPSR